MSERVIGMGIDLVRISRMEKALERRGPAFRRKVLGPAERQGCDSNVADATWFAFRFAAKEACLKALGTGWATGAAFHQVQVLPDGGLRLGGKAKERASALGVVRARASLTREGDLVGALVLLTG